MASKRQKIDPELIDSLLKDQDSSKVFDSAVTPLRVALSAQSMFE